MQRNFIFVLQGTLLATFFPPGWCLKGNQILEVSEAALMFPQQLCPQSHTAGPSHTLPVATGQEKRFKTTTGSIPSRSTEEMCYEEGHQTVGHVTLTEREVVESPVPSKARIKPQFNSSGS